MDAIYVKCHSVRILRILKSKFQNLKIQFNRQLGQVHLLINLTWVGVNRKNNCNFYPLRNVICLWSLSRRPSLWSPIELNLNLSPRDLPPSAPRRNYYVTDYFLSSSRENWMELVKTSLRTVFKLFGQVLKFFIRWEVVFL